MDGGIDRLRRRSYRGNVGVCRDAIDIKPAHGYRRTWRDMPQASSIGLPAAVVT